MKVKPAPPDVGYADSKSPQVPQTGRFTYYWIIWPRSPLPGGCFPACGWGGDALHFFLQRPDEGMLNLHRFLFLSQ